MSSYIPISTDIYTREALDFPKPQTNTNANSHRYKGTTQNVLGVNMANHFIVSAHREFQLYFAMKFETMGNVVEHWQSVLYIHRIYKYVYDTVTIIAMMVKL